MTQDDKVPHNKEKVGNSSMAKTGTDKFHRFLYYTEVNHPAKLKQMVIIVQSEEVCKRYIQFDQKQNPKLQ